MWQLEPDIEMRPSRENAKPQLQAVHFTRTEANRQDHQRPLFVRRCDSSAARACKDPAYDARSRVLKHGHILISLPPHVKQTATMFNGRGAFPTLQNLQPCAGSGEKFCPIDRQMVEDSE